MKQFDLTGIGSSVELGKGGSVVQDNNGNVLVNGKDVHSGIKGTWSPSELTAQTSLPWEVGTTGVVTLSNNDFTASFPGDLTAFAKITNFSVSGSEQGVYFTLNTANITAFGSFFGLAFSNNFDVDVGGFNVTAAVMFTYVSTNTFTVALGDPIIFDMSSASAQFTLTPTTQCCLTVDNTNTIRFYVDDNTGPTQIPLISYTVSNSPNTSPLLAAFAFIDYGGASGSYSVTILETATVALDGVNPGTGITSAFPVVTNTGSVDETLTPTGCANLSYIVDMPEGTKLNTSKGIIRDGDVVTFGPLETIISISSENKSILDVTVAPSVVQPLVAWNNQQDWLDLWFSGANATVHPPLGFIPLTDPFLSSPAIGSITNGVIVNDAITTINALYPIQQFNQSLYFSFNISFSSPTTTNGNSSSIYLYLTDYDTMTSNPGQFSLIIMLVYGRSDGSSIDPIEINSLPAGSYGYLMAIMDNIGSQMYLGNTVPSVVEITDFSEITAKQFTITVSDLGMCSIFSNGTVIDLIESPTPSPIVPITEFNSGIMDPLEDNAAYFYMPGGFTSITLNAFLTDATVEALGYTSFYVPTTNDPTNLSSTGPGSIVASDLYPGYFNRLVNDAYVDGDLISAGRIISVSDAGETSTISTTDDVPDLSNYAVKTGTANTFTNNNTFTNTNTFSGGTNYVPGEPEVPAIPEVPATSGYIIIDYSTNSQVIVNGGTFSGIEMSGVSYNPGYPTSQADISVDGSGTQNVSIAITPTVTTWQEILDAINTQTTGCVASFVGGTIKIISDTTGVSSVVSITDGSPNGLFTPGSGVIQSPVYGDALIPEVPAIPSTTIVLVPDVTFTHSINANGVELGTQIIHDGINASSKSILKGETINGVYPVIGTYQSLWSPPTFNSGIHFGSMIGDYNTNVVNFVDFGLMQQSSLNLDTAPPLNILRMTKNNIIGYIGNIQEPGIDDQTVFGWLNVNKPDNQYRPNIYFAGANLELSDITWVESPSILGIQLNASLDPGVTPTHGDTYLILDKDNLHANFGTIVGVANNDIVEYNTYYSPPVFEVVFEASVNTSSTTSYDGNELFFNGLNWSTKTIISQTNFSTGQHTTSGRIKFDGQDRDIIIGEQNYDPYVTDIVLDVPLQESNRFINATISEDAFVGVAMNGAATLSQGLSLGIIGDPTITNSPTPHAVLGFLRNPTTDTNTLLLSMQTYVPFLVVQGGTETNVTVTSYGVGDLVLRNYDTDASPPIQTASITISKTGIAIDSGVGNNTTVDKDPTVAMGIATKQYVDYRNMGAVTVLFNYNSTSPLNIGSAIPDNSIVTTCRFNITTPFDNAAATVTIGNGLDADGAAVTTDTDVTISGLQTVDSLFDVTTSGQLKITITPAGSTQGAGRVLVEYYVPSV